MAYRLRPLSDDGISSDIICSCCSSLVFRPRKYEIAQDSSCSHKFCYTCLNILKVSAIDPKQGEGLACPLCADAKSAAWKNNPLDVSDPATETILAALLVSCPFVPYGCEQKQLAMSSVASHVRSCEFRPGSCSECDMKNTVRPSDLDGGKHKGGCTMQCECGRKIRKSDESRHRGMCPLKGDITQPSFIPKASPWEAALVNRKNAPADVEGCIKAASEKKQIYLESLQKAKKASAESFGQNTLRPRTDLLDEMASLYATAIGIDTEQKQTKGGHVDETLHLGLARVLEEAVLCAEMFPAAIVGRQKSVANENEVAADSFMSDEVDGFLEQLGIAKSASDATKIRAMEEEYQRLKEEGLGDKAAEVQGLYAWKMKQVAGASGLSGWNDAHGGVAGVAASMAHVFDKYQDTLSINPANAEAK